MTKQEFWFKHIENWQSSGLKQKEYCEKENLSMYSFTSWRTQFLSAKNERHKNEAVTFLPAKVKDSQNGNSIAITVLLPNQIKLALPSGMSQHELLDVLTTLRKLS